MQRAAKYNALVLGGATPKVQTPHEQCLLLLVHTYRLHKHVKLRLLRGTASSSSSSSSSSRSGFTDSEHHTGLRVAALQSQFVFKVTASLGDDEDLDEAEAAAEAEAPPRSGLGVAAAAYRSTKAPGSSSIGPQGRNSSNQGVEQRPKGAVLEAFDGFGQQEFAEAVQSADDVMQVYPDRVISITQGVFV